MATTSGLPSSVSASVTSSTALVDIELSETKVSRRLSVPEGNSSKKANLDRGGKELTDVVL